MLFRSSKETERLLNDELVPRFGHVERQARRKLLCLHRARRLDDLRTPPGNRLKALRGGRRGQHSICINDQWCICFRLREGNACDVETVSIDDPYYGRRKSFLACPLRRVLALGFGGIRRRSPRRTSSCGPGTAT